MFRSTLIKLESRFCFILAEIRFFLLNNTHTITSFAKRMWFFEELLCTWAFTSGTKICQKSKKLYTKRVYSNNLKRTWGRPPVQSQSRNIRPFETQLERQDKITWFWTDDDSVWFHEEDLLAKVVLKRCKRHREKIMSVVFCFETLLN